VRGLRRVYVGFRQDGVDYVRPDRPSGTLTEQTLFKNIEWAKKDLLSHTTPLTTADATPALSDIAGDLARACPSGRCAAAVRSGIWLRVGATMVLIAILLFDHSICLRSGLVGRIHRKDHGGSEGRPALDPRALIRDGTSTELLPDGKSSERQTLTSPLARKISVTWSIVSAFAKSTATTLRPAPAFRRSCPTSSSGISGLRADR